LAARLEASGEALRLAATTLAAADSNPNIGGAADARANTRATSQIPPIQRRLRHILVLDFASGFQARLDRFCDTSTIMCVVHFPSPSTGRVGRCQRLIASA
jgi:hypothetical protein